MELTINHLNMKLINYAIFVFILKLYLNSYLSEYNAKKN